jgi:hypothetical protein
MQPYDDLYKYFSVSGIVKLHEDGAFDVDGSATLRLHKITRLPIRFHIVDRFECSSNMLTTLDGSPKSCLRFYFNHNLLTNLIGGPSKAIIYDVIGNVLTSLDGLPEEVKNFRMQHFPGTPLLKLLTLNIKDGGSIIIYKNDDEWNPETTTIIEKYRSYINSGKGIKEAIWRCQKELIDEGFEGNARW